MLKLSYTTMATPGIDGVRAIKKAKYFGYDGVDLRVSDNKGELTLKSSDKEIKNLTDVFTSEGIQLSGLLCYNKKWGNDHTSWDKMRDSILQNLDVAARIGSPSIRIFAGNPSVFNNYNDYIRRFADAIIEILEKDTTKVKILIQNHNNSFSALDCCETIKLVNNPRFRLVFSPDHCLLMNENLKKVCVEVKDVTEQLYVADLKKTENNDKMVHLLPGNGNVDIKSAYSVIGGKHFSGWVTFKWERIWNPELENADIALPYFINYINKIYAEL